MPISYEPTNTIKKMGEDLPLTPEESDEWLACAMDPWYFFENYCYMSTPKGLQLFSPRDYQEDILNIILDNRFSVINSQRQSGKSALVVLIVLWMSIFQKNITSSLASYKESGFLDLMFRFKTTYLNLPEFLKPCIVTNNKKEVVFDNGCIIFGQVISDNTGRGRTITGALVLDELSFVEEKVARAAHTSYMPSLEAAGDESTSKLIIISTPAGTSGLYAELAFGAMNDTNGFVYYKTDPTKIPGRQRPGWAEDQKRKVGTFAFLQEYMGEFISNKGTLISSIKIEELAKTTTIDPIETFGEETDIFVHDVVGRNLAFSVDVSDGIGKDNTIIEVFDINTLEQVAEFADNMLNQTMFTRYLIRLLKYFHANGCGEMYLGIERNGLGAGVLRLVETSEDSIFDHVSMINDVDEYGNPKQTTGLTTTKKSKIDGCGMLKDLVEADKLTIRSKKLLNELRFFIKQNTSFAAEKGTTDDRVMATVVFMNMLNQLAHYEDDVYESINDVDDAEETWGIMF